MRATLRAARVLALVLLPACGHRATPAPASVAKGQTEPAAGSAYLGDLGRQAARAGGSALEVLASGAGIPGDSLTAFVAIPAGRCALLAARGAEQVGDLDLYLYGDDGDEIAKADDVVHPATLVHCASKAERVLVVARIAAGRGPYALALVDAPGTKEAELRRRFLPDAPELETASEDFPGLTSALATRQDERGGTFRDLRRVLVPVDHRLPTQLDASVSAEHCVDVLALPGSDALDLSLEALDEHGRTLARAEERGGERALLLCAGAEAARVTLRLRPHAGRGTVLVALSQTTHVGARRDLHPDCPRSDLSPPPERPPPLAPAATRLELSTSNLVVHPLSWTGCQRVELEPRFPLFGYRFLAYDGRGQVVAEHEGTGRTTLYLCLPRSSGSPGQLQLRATLRGGPLDIQSLAESAPAEATLAKAPLAASRLLGLAADMGFLDEVAGIGQVSEHEASPDELVRIPLLVPAERCLTVLAGAQRSGVGLELGLVDMASARFVDFARGAHLAWVRACADQGRTEDLIVELRAAHGQTTVLLSTRQEPLMRPSAALPR